MMLHINRGKTEERLPYFWVWRLLLLHSFVRTILFSLSSSCS